MVEKTLSMREGEFKKDIEVATWQQLKEMQRVQESAEQLLAESQKELRSASERLDAAKTYLNAGLLIGLLGIGALLLMILEKV